MVPAPARTTSEQSAAEPEPRPERALPGCAHLSDAQWLALCRKKGIHPLTARPLRPGQRLPTQAEAGESAKRLTLERPRKLVNRFCTAPWRICEERCRQWQRHMFAAECSDTAHFRSGVDLSADELALFLWDLRCWQDLVRKSARGACPHPGPLHAYLLPGREDWGILAIARDWDLKEEMVARWLAREDAPAEDEEDWDDEAESPLGEGF